MKNHRIVTLSFRKIKKSYKRFFSLVILSLLGFSFFIGMKISMPSLLLSLDKYYKDMNVYDVEIISTNGLNEEDINALDMLDTNIKVYGMHSKDVLFNYGDSNTDVIRIRELNSDINKMQLLDGRMPSNIDEIVIDEKYLLNPNAKIGDTLDLVIKENDTDLKVNKLKIVGIVNSPIYLATNEGSLNRGNTLIGNGEIKYYVYALKDIFNIDYYTEIYIDNLDIVKEITNTKEYNDKVQKVIDKIDAIKDERIKYRYNELRTIALNKVEEKENEVFGEINSTKDKLDGIKIELDSAKEKIDSGTKEIRNIERDLTTKKKELDNAKNSINNYDNLLNVAHKNQNNALTKDDIISILPDDDKESTINNLTLAESFGADLTNLTRIKEQINQYGIDADGTTTSKIERLENSLDIVLQIEDGYSLYDEKTKELKSYKSKIKTAKEKYDENYTKYIDAATELNEKEESAKKEFEKARKEIDEKIVEGTWHIRNRLDNTDYTGFIDSIESLKKLSFIFPIIFFVISIFISLLSMTRMSIEDRSEMGTLKAFGFSKIEILMQYIIYSLLATVLGVILGLWIGVYFFPNAVFDVYTKLYAIPKLVYTNYIGVVLLGIIISVVCIVGSTILSVMNILRDNTVSLLRPIAPPIGKKILLEKYPLFWNRITFENKVTLRNLFRYKRRVIMTLLGIVSCTMILTSAFLIRDSITTVLDKQFNEIFKYDSIVYLDGSKISYELDEIFSDPHISEKVYVDTERVKIDSTSANLVIPNDINALDKVVKLRNKKGELSLSNDGVIITSKISKIFKVKKNDIITIRMTDNSEHKLKVIDITENYVGNYIYMSKDLYRENIGMHKLNMAYLKLDNNENEEKVIKDLLDKNDNILNYLSINNNVAMVKNMFISLDKVVLMVVIFSLLLSLVVLYSLAYIVISERQREIATLKVLGFDDEEVDMYLLKEQVMIVTTGILIGLIVGIIYALTLVDTLEITMIQFNKEFLFRNFMISLMLMLVFAAIVGNLIHVRLKKINMIESLKSVE